MMARLLRLAHLRGSAPLLRASVGSAGMGFPAAHRPAGLRRAVMIDRPLAGPDSLRGSVQNRGQDATLVVRDNKNQGLLWKISIELSASRRTCSRSSLTSKPRPGRGG